MNSLLFLNSNFLSEYVSRLDNSLGIWYLIILNAFGVMAILLKICEYQAKTRNTMFAITICANLCWVLYFALYGNLTSALTCFINLIKLFIFYFRGKYAWASSFLWMIVFLCAQTAVAVFTFEGITSAFAILAGYCGIFAYYFTNQKKYRVCSLVHMLLWVANGIINFYPLALVSDTLSVFSVATAIYRFDLKNKTNASEEGKNTND